MALVIYSGLRRAYSLYNCISADIPFIFLSPNRLDKAIQRKENVFCDVTFALDPTPYDFTKILKIEFC